MPQPASKRLVTEQKLLDTIATDIPSVVKRQKTRLLGDQFSPVISGSVPQVKAVVSLTTGSTVDGLSGTGVKAYQPSAMYEIAECNWNDQTLGTFGESRRNMSKSNNVSTCFDFTTLFEGSMAMFMSFKAAGMVQDLKVWIDDVAVSDWFLGTRADGVMQVDTPVIPCVVDDTNYYLNINFPNRGLYKIRIAGTILSGTLGLMHCNAEGKFHKPKKSRVFGVISDSIYDTTYATNTSLNAGVDISTYTGWSQWNMAVGGSGFVNPSSAPNGPHNFGSNAVFAALAKAPQLDLLLLNGSLSDLAYPEADVLNAMRSFFDRFRSVRPTTPIVWQGLTPQSYFESTYTSQVVKNREIAQQAVALADQSVIGAIMPAKEDWLTGTGRTSDPNGTGNQDFQIGPDGLHFSPFGCLVNGRLVSSRLASMSTWNGG